MPKLKRWLYAIAIAIFSTLLVAYAYDIEKEIPIEPSSTQAGRQDILITVADALGLTGSILVALVATGIGLYYAIRQHFTR
ncbi:MAG: hypothetical protein IT240_10345 [Bacteroidia bacterium]|jgi:hypothetical protein|nr:hypothetical protein [Bacteroidia bacterium]MCC6769433.1 hypothetical protein [Bacteroidia bacterium]